MSMMIRRSVQGMVKVVSDQVGIQEDAEQSNILGRGHVEDMVSSIETHQVVFVGDHDGRLDYVYGRYGTAAKTVTITNSGFQNY